MQNNVREEFKVEDIIETENMFIPLDNIPPYKESEGDFSDLRELLEDFVDLKDLFDDKEYTSD